MNTALLDIDVQQGLCEGEHAAFIRAIPTDNVRFDAIGQQP
jgi:nicotinamidase-related amidase